MYWLESQNTTLQRSCGIAALCLFSSSYLGHLIRGASQLGMKGCGLLRRVQITSLTLSSQGPT